MTTNMNNKMTCGQALIKLLEEYRVDTVFGIPGVHTLDLYDGLSGSAIRHVLTRHEQGAGFMADGYARTTGKPGVCFTITGPGVTNIATPIGQAYADSVPMLVISSVNKVASMGKGRGELHETKDQRAITAPITAFSATAFCPDEVPGLIARAFAVFNSERPRPVCIEIPLDVMCAPIGENWSGKARQLAPRPAPARSSLEAAAELLQGARKPMIIAGGGAVNAGPALQMLAERLDAAVFTTVAGKGLLPENHPLNGGSLLCVSPCWDYVAQADLVLAVGTELAETDMWREKLPIQGSLIRVDIDPAKMNDLYPADVAIVADAGESLKALTLALSTSQPLQRENPASALRALKAAVLAELEPLQQIHKQVLDVVRKVLPEDAFVATDMTQLAYSGNYLFGVDKPRTWLHPTGYGTLGYGLPAAIGAKCGNPDRPGLVIAGDGGFLYTLQEMATAVEELDRPFVVLLWNNDSLGQIRDDMVAQGIEEIGVSPKNPDFIKLAEGFGCRAKKPESLQQLEGELIEAFAFNGVTLIQMNQDRIAAR